MTSLCNELVTLIPPRWRNTLAEALVKDAGRRGARSVDPESCATIPWKEETPASRSENGTQEHRSSQMAEPAINDPELHEKQLLAASELLAEAANMIRRATSALNTRSENCETCGFAHYDAYDQFRMARDLRATADSLTKKSGWIADIVGAD